MSANRVAARLAGKTPLRPFVMLAVFAPIDPALRKSITFDNVPPSLALLQTTRAC